MKKYFLVLIVVLAIAMGVGAIVTFASPGNNTGTSGNNQSKNNSGVSAIANVPEKSVATDIGLAAAKEVALTHAGLTENQVTYTKTKLERDNGVYVYDIEFVTSDTKYEYEILSTDGSIYEFSKEAINKVPSGNGSGSKPANPVTPVTPAKDIGLAAAKKAALTHAGLAENQVTYTKTKLERDNGVYVYDIEFVTSDTKYEYEILSTDGSIHEFSKEAINKVPSGNGSGSKPANPVTPVTPAKDIGLAAAKKAALTHAGLTENQVTYTKTKLERDDGVYVYDIEFVTSDTKYEYEILSANGSIHEFSKKAINRGSSGGSKPTKPIAPTTPANDIGLAAAKKAALTHAGLTENQVTYIKTKLERDDGVYVYDIEFVTSDIKYEYEILSANGSIHEFSKEAINRGSSGGSKPTKPIAPTTPTTDIGLAAAKKAALAYTGLAENQVVFTKTKLDRDDGIFVYEIEFIANGMEYELEINAANGTVVDYESEPQTDD